MKKLTTLLFCLTVASLTAYGLLWPNYMIVSFLEFSEPYVHMRVLMILVLMPYVFIPAARNSATKLLVSAGAVMALIFGAVTAFSPMFMGRLDGYLPIGDVFIFIEGGILALLAAIELPAARLPLNRSLAYRLSLPFARLVFSAKLRMIYNPSIRGGT